MAKYNPFNPNSIVTPMLFAGRTGQALVIIDKLEHVKKKMPASFALHGDRGIGKTALAKLIKHVAESNDPKLRNLHFLTSYYSAEKGQNIKSVLASCLNDLTDQMPSSVLNRLGERLGSIFKNGKFSFGAFGFQAGYEKASDQNGARDQILKDQATSALTNILKGLEEETDNKYDGLLIIIDETHNIEDISNVAQLLRGISTTLDVKDLGNLSFMLIGYSDSIKDFFAGDPSATRHFDTIHLLYMPHNEAKEILTKGFEEAAVGWDEKELDKQITVAGGYPHAVQVLGRHLVDIDQDNYIGKDDWDTALKKTAIELQTKDFSHLYNFRGKKRTREEVMNILALSGKPMRPQRIAEDLGGKNIYTKNCLGELKRIGAVREDAEAGKIFLQSGLLRTAILLHIYPKVEKDEKLKEMFIKYMSEY